jgi:hypothetical protein
MLPPLAGVRKIPGKPGLVGLTRSWVIDVVGPLHRRTKCAPAAGKRNRARCVGARGTKKEKVRTKKS